MQLYIRGLPSTVEVRARVSNYIPLFNVDVIPYLCPYHNADSAKQVK